MTNFAKTSENARPSSLQQTVRARPIFDIGDLSLCSFFNSDSTSITPIKPRVIFLNFYGQSLGLSSPTIRGVQGIFFPWAVTVFLRK